MTLDSGSLRSSWRQPSSWPLSRQVVLVFLAVTVLALALSGWFVRRAVSTYLTERFEDNNQVTWKFLAGAILEPLLSRDLPLLESIVEQSFQNDDQILAMEIEDREGKPLVNRRNKNLTSQRPPLTVAHAIVYQGRPQGRLTIQWATDRAFSRIEREGLMVLLLLAGLVGLFAAVLVLVVNRLVVRPIRQIHRHLVDVAEGQADAKLSLQAAREVNYLVQAANSLQEHVQAEGIRKKELELEIAALTNQVAQLGQYTLLEKIGEGGMGAVYKAQHALLRRPTAVKLLRSQLGGPQALIRFEREVQLTSGLTHPNTIAIYDYGRTEGGVFYYAMEFLEGVNLEQLVQDFGPQPAARVAHILRQVLLSLREAHQAGLIHRDIKPANVFLCQRGGVLDVVKVLDFGLVAETSAPGETAGEQRGLCGTPHYMAPEAIRNPAAVDARSDLYALAAMGCFLLTGRTIFSRPTLAEVLNAHLEETPAAPTQASGCKMSGELEALLMDNLRKDAGRRSASAAAFLDRLQACPEANLWTEGDARRWWLEHPQAQQKQATARTAPQTLTLSRIQETPAPTMTVDLQPPKKKGEAPAATEADKAR